MSAQGGFGGWIQHTISFIWTVDGYWTWEQSCHHTKAFMHLEYLFIPVQSFTLCKEKHRKGFLMTYVSLCLLNPSDVQESSEPDEPGSDPETDAAQPIWGDAGEDQCHGGRAPHGSEGQTSGAITERHAVHLQWPLHRRPAAHSHRAGESRFLCLSSWPAESVSGTNSSTKGIFYSLLNDSASFDEIRQGLLCKNVYRFVQFPSKEPVLKNVPGVFLE